MAAFFDRLQLTLPTGNYPGPSYCLSLSLFFVLYCASGTEKSSSSQNLLPHSLRLARLSRSPLSASILVFSPPSFTPSPHFPPIPHLRASDTPRCLFMPATLRRALFHRARKTTQRPCMQSDGDGVHVRVLNLGPRERRLRLDNGTVNHPSKAFHRSASSPIYCPSIYSPPPHESTENDSWSTRYRDLPPPPRALSPDYTDTPCKRRIKFFLGGGGGNWCPPFQPINRIKFSLFRFSIIEILGVPQNRGIL